MKATQEVKAFLKAAASLGGKARAKARTKAQRTAQARTAPARGGAARLP